MWERVYLLPKKQSSQRVERSHFLASLVKSFDVDAAKVRHSHSLHSLTGLCQIDLGLQVYVAEVLAYLPYRIPEDPLSVVYHVNKLIAMRGETVRAQVKVRFCFPPKC